VLDGCQTMLRNSCTCLSVTFALVHAILMKFNGAEDRSTRSNVLQHVTISSQSQDHPHSAIDTAGPGKGARAAA
jgi:hypothetical protein